MATLASKVYKHIKDLDFPDISHYPQGIVGILQFEQDLLGDKI